MDMTFKKRAGTSGISGQLYETKLISLILFRLLHDDDVEEFCLASNMEEVGAFDDICLRVKIATREHPILVFIQAKHKDDEDKNLNFDLIKNFHASLVQVKQQFSGGNNVLFNGFFNETDCLFILYTNAKYFDDSVNVELDRTGSTTVPIFKHTSRPYRSPFSDKLNDLIGTGDKDVQGSQITYTKKDMEFVNDNILEQEITTLAEHFAKFLNNKSNQSMNIMLDNYILKYHVILAESVVDISEIRSEEKTPVQWRDLTFRSDFFTTNDKILTMLRKAIFKQLFKNIILPEVKNQINKNKIDETKQKATSEHYTAKSCSTSSVDSNESTVEKLISTFLSKPSASTLSPLIGTHISYKKGNLKFISEKPNDKVQKLKQISISQATIDEAEAIVARNIVSSLKLKVPVTFGNIDLTIAGNAVKVEKRLNILADFFKGLCEESKLIDSYKIITVDVNVGEGFLSVKGGIGAAVGNVLIHDKVTNLMKFTEDCTLLKTNAKALFNKLSNKIHNLHLYRLDARTLKVFPKLIFDYTNEAERILDNVVIYEKQSNHSGVETILKKEIEMHHKINNLPVKYDTMFIHYHNEIQKWWMSPKTGKYLIKSKNDNIFQQAINNIIAEPQISAMQTTYNMNNMKYFRYYFSESAMNTLTSLEINPRAIIITNIPTLTIIKVTRWLKNNYAILDLDCALNLASEDFLALKTELIDAEKSIIVVCECTVHSRHPNVRLLELAQATANKKVVIITNNIFVQTALEYFPETNVIYDEEQSLIDLIPEVQLDILKNAAVIFQGQRLKLNSLLDDESVAIINGAVLNKIIHDETITIGKPLGSSSYKDIKHLYIDRRLNRASNCQMYGNFAEVYTDYGHVVKTFHDIEDDIVLLASPPGMGKSTLLTHVSLNTKEVDQKLWILRINLLDHSQVFYKWQTNKTVINTLETLYFMCRVVLENDDILISLKERNGEVYLESSMGDELTTFELNVFLHFYNKGRLIFLFDGFDEICPNYKDNIIKVFKVIKNFPRKHKMWVASRPYTNILPDLERVLGESYEIECIDTTEQQIYLIKTWQSKLKFENLSDIHIYNIKELLCFTSDKNRYEDDMKLDNGIINFFGHFFEYVCLQYSSILTDIGASHSYVRELKRELDRSLIIDAKLKADKYKCGRLLDKFLGTPLHLYLLADYIVNLVFVNKKIVCSKLNVNIYNIYEMFIETKLRTVFQEKDKTDVTKPGVMRKRDKELADCVSMHKRLAAYSLLKTFFQHKDFLNSLKDMRPFKNENSAELSAMLNIIKSGTEKTGLISHVTDHDKPIFEHRNFAEYFAAEYIYDILKSDKFDVTRKKRLLYLLKRYSRLLQDWLSPRTKIDKDFEVIYSSVSPKQDAYDSNCSLL